MRLESFLVVLFGGLTLAENDATNGKQESSPRVRGWIENRAPTTSPSSSTPTRPTTTSRQTAISTSSSTQILSSSKSTTSSPSTTPSLTRTSSTSSISSLSSTSSRSSSSSIRSSMSSSTTSLPLPTSYVDFGITFSGFKETKHNITYGFTLPPSNATEFLGEIIAPVANKWVGVAIGSLNSNMIAGWPNDTQVVGSSRFLSSGLAVQPNLVMNLTTVASSVNNTHWSWVYRCANCTEWSGGKLAVNGTQSMTWLVGLQPVLTPEADNSTLSAISDIGTWQQDLAAAQNSGYSNFTVASSSSWVRRTMFPSKSIGQSRYGPAIATHAGKLWISGVINDQSLWYASGTNTVFAQSTTNVNSEIAAEGPALAEFADVLHLVFPDKTTGNLVHLQYDDASATWGQRVVTAFASTAPATLTTFNGALVLAYIDGTQNNRLYVAQWDPENLWSGRYDLGGSPQTWGTAALYALGSQIYLLYVSNNSGRHVQALTSTAWNSPWVNATAPNESTAFGTSAATYENTAVMAFQSNNGKGQLFASIYNGVSWAGHEDTGQTTSHTPAVAVLDGIANCIFSSHDSSSTVLWTQRPVSPFSLSSWMAHLSDSLLLSQLSIPGSHDSASVTIVPFTATQDLSITDQLSMGIRFFDLRCTIVDNVLEMYHGSIPLGTFLSDILGEIYSFIGNAGSSEAIIVSIKQDHDPVDSNVPFDLAVLRLLQQNGQFWNLGATIPTLGTVRGKIQLVRRYSSTTSPETSIGIAATGWQDNVPTFNITLPNGAFVIEDRYNYDGVVGLDLVVTNKTSYLLTSLVNAQNDNTNSNWYISFSSASNTPFNEPETLAVGGIAIVPPGFVDGVNSRLFTYLYSLLGGTRRVGTIMMDFVDTPDGGGLPELIISLNG
ncbi:PLC-like phosphodiesterase [Mycena indigotica]|uniref:PLC-like phosphodiesterase n=1 Tax=Mycena indigotica TaxID=2126181 RepID=A0A8H6T835_9AGAR|nr:PLC-like phosphodiesterase [Mycena indigotica]KAF7311951.1 PLC-like phosphodiesterase [Mycena indigotica]